MFIGLTFVSFFLYEVMKGLRLHPMQYLLATLASTLLIGFYVSSMLRSATHGGVITTALLLLYGMLYGILVSEDNSLLMGSLLIFSVLSLVMIVTRRVDWYAITDELTVNIGSRMESSLMTANKPE